MMPSPPLTTPLPLARRPIAKFVVALLKACGVALLCILLLEVGAYMTYGTSPISAPERFEVSAAYAGWITIDYARAECPPSETDGLFKIFRVPPSGQVCTSDKQPTGWVYREIYYIAYNGDKTPLRWGDAVSGGSAWLISGTSTESRLIIFVGNKDEFTAAQVSSDHPR
jgi:hypothetical protein